MKNLHYLLIVFCFVQIAKGQSIQLSPGNTTEGTVISRSNQPIITVYGSGSPQSTKMILGHSGAYPNYGIQYGFNGNFINFLGAGQNAMAVDLNNHRVGVNNAAPVHTLDVTGTINATSNIFVNGVPIAPYTPPYVYSSPWMTSPTNSVDTTVDGTCLRSRRLAIPQLTQAMIDGASITVYFRVGSLSPYLLPYVSDAGGNTNMINAFFKKPGEIIVYRHTFDTCRFNSGIPESYPGQPVLVNLPQSLEYRVVIIK